jgi:hypothetical protein
VKWRGRRSAGGCGGVRRGIARGRGGVEQRDVHLHELALDRLGLVRQKGHEGHGHLRQKLSATGQVTGLACMGKRALYRFELQQVLVGELSGGLSGCAVPFVGNVDLL